MPLFFSSASLESVSVYKHLGLTFSSDLKWNNHIDDINARADKRLCQLEVVVVNHCFTSLLGTNGILSDIVIRWKRCSQLIRWMMYRWWCEGGGDRAWWVIESVYLRSPNKGFLEYLGDLPPDMPRWQETWVLLCKLMLKSVAFRAAPLSSGRIVPRVTIGRVTPFIPSWET